MEPTSIFRRPGRRVSSLPLTPIRGRSGTSRDARYPLRREAPARGSTGFTHRSGRPFAPLSPSSRVAAPAAYRGPVLSLPKGTAARGSGQSFDTRPLARSLLRMRERGWRRKAQRPAQQGRRAHRRQAEMRCVNPVGSRTGATPAFARAGGGGSIPREAQPGTVGIGQLQHHVSVPQRVSGRDIAAA